MIINYLFQIKYYENFVIKYSSQQKFLKGWLNRSNDLLISIEKYIIKKI